MVQNGPPEADARIFIARQPIFDKNRHVYAYELLYRSDLVNRAYVADNGYATMKVIANSLLIGLQQLTGGKRAFIHFNWRLLLGRVPLLFPRDLMGVQILDVPELGPEIMRVCKDIKRTGYLTIMDHFVLLEKYKNLLPITDMIKIDFRQTEPEQRTSIVRKAKSLDLKLMAEKIESQDEFREALDNGYIYFQGYYFQKPDIVSRKEMAGYKVNYLHIMKKLYDPVLHVDQIEEIIKHDVSLTYKLLRFINSASHGFRVTIRSIHHALLLLGKREIKKWLTIIVMSGIGQEQPPELMNIAVIRARFSELIAETFKLPGETSDFFLIGMFSMMEVFLNRPLEDILSELPLEDHVKNALLGKDNTYNNVLELVQAFEKADWNDVTTTAAKMNLDEEKLALLYVEAVGWVRFLSED